MVDAEDFVSGPSIRWGRLGQAIFGSSILAVIYGVSEGFQTLFLGIVGLGERGAFAVSDLILRSFGIVLRGYDAAQASFSESVALLGPVALPVGALVGVGVLWVLNWVVENV